MNVYLFFSRRQRNPSLPEEARDLPACSLTLLLGLPSPSMLSFRVLIDNLYVNVPFSSPLSPHLLPRGFQKNEYAFSTPGPDLQFMASLNCAPPPVTERPGFIESPGSVLEVIRSLCLTLHSTDSGTVMAKQPLDAEFSPSLFLGRRLLCYSAFDAPKF